MGFNSGFKRWNYVTVEYSRQIVKEVLQTLTMACSFVLIRVHQWADCCYPVLPKLCFLSCSWTWIRVTKFMGQSLQRFSGTPLQSGTHTSSFVAAATYRRCSPRLSRNEHPFPLFLRICVSWSWLERCVYQNVFLYSIRVTQFEPVTQYVGTISTPPAMFTTWRRYCTTDSDGRAGK